MNSNLLCFNCISIFGLVTGYGSTSIDFSGVAWEILSFIQNVNIFCNIWLTAIWFWFSHVLVSSGARTGGYVFYIQVVLEAWMTAVERKLVVPPSRALILASACCSVRRYPYRWNTVQSIFCVVSNILFFFPRIASVIGRSKMSPQCSAPVLCHTTRPTVAKKPSVCGGLHSAVSKMTRLPSACPFNMATWSMLL